MKIRKTKKGNSIRRIVAFLLCMTMVLGLGMQDVMEQVYAEEASVAMQQDVQGAENNENGEQDAGPETPEETPSPTEEKDNVPDNTVPGNTPVAENESGSEVPSDSSVPGQSADGQGSGHKAALVQHSRNHCAAAFLHGVRVMYLKFKALRLLFFSK